MVKTNKKSGKKNAKNIRSRAAGSSRRASARSRPSARPATGHGLSRKGFLKMAGVAAAGVGAAAVGLGGATRAQSTTGVVHEVDRPHSSDPGDSDYDSNYAELNYHLIQDKLDAAEVGDTVLLQPGVYDLGGHDEYWDTSAPNKEDWEWKNTGYFLVIKKGVNLIGPEPAAVPVSDEHPMGKDWSDGAVIKGMGCLDTKIIDGFHTGLYIRCVNQVGLATNDPVYIPEGQPGFGEDHSDGYVHIKNIYFDSRGIHNQLEARSTHDNILSHGKLYRNGRLQGVGLLPESWLEGGHLEIDNCKFDNGQGTHALSSVNKGHYDVIVKNSEVFSALDSSADNWHLAISQSDCSKISICDNYLKAFASSQLASPGGLCIQLSAIYHIDEFNERVSDCAVEISGNTMEAPHLMTILNVYSNNGVVKNNIFNGQDIVAYSSELFCPDPDSQFGFTTTTSPEEAGYKKSLVDIDASVRGWTFTNNTYNLLSAPSLTIPPFAGLTVVNDTTITNERFNGFEGWSVAEDGQYSGYGAVALLGTGSQATALKSDDPDFGMDVCTQVLDLSGYDEPKENVLFLDEQLDIPLAQRDVALTRFNGIFLVKTVGAPPVWNDCVIADAHFTHPVYGVVLPVTKDSGAPYKIYEIVVADYSGKWPFPSPHHLSAEKIIETTMDKFGCGLPLWNHLYQIALANIAPAQVAAIDPSIKAVLSYDWPSNFDTDNPLPGNSLVSFERSNYDTYELLTPIVTSQNTACPDIDFNTINNVLPPWGPIWDGLVVEDISTRIAALFTPYGLPSNLPPVGIWTLDALGLRIYLNPATWSLEWIADKIYNPLTNDFVLNPEPDPPGLVRIKFCYPPDNPDPTTYNELNPGPLGLSYNICVTQTGAPAGFPPCQPGTFPYVVECPSPYLVVSDILKPAKGGLAHRSWVNVARTKTELVTTEIPHGNPGEWTYLKDIPRQSEDGGVANTSENGNSIEGYEHCVNAFGKGKKLREKHNSG
jgi:hypothetical protein